MHKLVTIKIFNFVNDLYLAKSFLESEGITCFTKDEFINQVGPFYTNAVNGVKLEVLEEDAENAVRLLIEGGFAKPEDYEIPDSMEKTSNIINRIKNIFKK